MPWLSRLTFPSLAQPPSAHDALSRIPEFAKFPESIFPERLKRSRVRSLPDGLVRFGKNWGFPFRAHESHESHEDRPESSAGQRFTAFLMRSGFFRRCSREAREPREDSPESAQGRHSRRFLASAENLSKPSRAGRVRVLSGDPRAHNIWSGAYFSMFFKYGLTQHLGVRHAL